MAKAGKNRGSEETPAPLDVYRTMLRARLVDEKAIVLYKQNKCHFQIGCAGHEAIGVAAGLALRAGHDWSYPYYRDMAFAAALGMTNEEFLLNIMNKHDDPNSGGRQMPMHYGHKDLNIVCQSSPTGTQFLQAVGTAMGLKYQGSDAVVYVSAGEGTTAQGAYYEALNWAARAKLPVIFVIQDNKWAISVHVSEQLAGGVAKVSSGFEGLDVVAVDGLSFEKSYAACRQAVNRARAGEGPTVIVAQVTRLQSHSISDNQSKYRTPEDLAKTKELDPIVLFEQELISKKLASAAQLSQIREELAAAIDTAAEWADEQPSPPPHTAEDHLYSTGDPGAGVEEVPATGPESFMVDAINHALDEELGLNPKMVVYGEDVAGGKGGVFSATVNLTAKHGPNRVFNSPLAEDSICGTAVGLAVMGMKPVVEIQFGDYIWPGMHQIRNELAMMRYRSNNNFSCPAVIRVAVGGYINGGIYHSQNIEATFSHFPGLLVLYPSNATDAKGLLKAAIRANDPVLFLEHKGLYRQVYAKGKEGGINDLIPIGRARLAREGSDLSIICYGALVQKSLVVAKKLAEEGVEIEVLDLRSIRPLDTTAIQKSVKKTNKVLVAFEDNLFMGFGSEISAYIAESCFHYLDAPVMRVAAADTPIPHSPILEETVLPQINDIEKAVRELLQY